MQSTALHTPCGRPGCKLVHMIPSQPDHAKTMMFNCATPQRKNDPHQSHHMDHHLRCAALVAVNQHNARCSNNICKTAVRLGSTRWQQRCGIQTPQPRARDPRKNRDVACQCVCNNTRRQMPPREEPSIPTRPHDAGLRQRYQNIILSSDGTPMEVMF